MEVPEHQCQLAHLFLFSHVDTTNNISNRSKGGVVIKLLRIWDHNGSNQYVFGWHNKGQHYYFMKEQQPATSKQNKSYTICCYAVDANQDDEVVNKKPFFQKGPMLVREIASKIRFKNLEHINKEPIYELLNDLYEGKNPPTNIYSQLANKRINPVLHGGEQRDDLEYYIPQIITYMVLQKNLQDEQLINFVLNGCSTDFFFAHRIYFYLKSLSTDYDKKSIPIVCDFLNEKLVEKMMIYQHSKLSGIEFTKSMILMDHQFKSKRAFNQLVDQYENEDQKDERLERDLLMNRQLARQTWRDYGTKRYPFPLPDQPPPIPKVHPKRYCTHGFMETPQFWDDLLEIGNIQNLNDQILVSSLMEINQKLPANVYIPFFKQDIRLYTILAVWKGRLFSTKMRSPYSVWIQIYREEEQLNLAKVEEEELGEANEDSAKKGKKNILQKIYDTLSKPFSISGQKNTLNIKKFFTEKLSMIEQSVLTNSKKTVKSRKSPLFSSFTENRSRRISISDVYEEERHQTKSEGRESSASSASEQNDDLLHTHSEQQMVEYFGAKSEDFIKQVKDRSIYREMKSWRLVHLMIKTGDDIKQEQFAMQLISRFQYAFKKEKIDCVVFPYEVISLGPDCGIIEMLNDITTLDSLFQKLRRKGLTLRQFFDKVFPNPVEARRNFMRSLAGYSILTYFLQVKDRHNGNILLSRDGHIIHIDFGFFLSNAPGKGVELQRNVPFKLLTEYVEVIGSLNSEQFFQFRQLFYKGFSAVLKHKQAILTLVKLMYSSHMQSMGCFIRGYQTIVQLEQRFTIQQRVESFCYDLINSSLDNWRARWYDKFQYFLQKIYY